MDNLDLDLGSFVFQLFLCEQFVLQCYYCLIFCWLLFIMLFDVFLMLKFFNVMTLFSVFADNLCFLMLSAIILNTLILRIVSFS